jgi:hypothetical protein
MKSKISERWLFLLVLLGGPVLAFIVLFLGCFDPMQLLGVACGHNFPLSLVLFTIGSWLLLAVGVAIFSAIQDGKPFG